MEVILVYITFPDAGHARQIASALVEKQLVACVNLIPKVESIYHWEGETRIDSEVLAMAKTTSSALQQLKFLVKEMHPYDNPELIVTQVIDGADDYLEWVQSQVVR